MHITRTNFKTDKPKITNKKKTRNKKSNLKKKQKTPNSNTKYQIFQLHLIH